MGNAEFGSYGAAPIRYCEMTAGRVPPADGRRRETDGRRTGDGHRNRPSWTEKFEISTSGAKISLRKFSKKNMIFFFLPPPRGYTS